VEDFFQQKLPDRHPADFLIRVNRQPVTAEQTLQDGDRVTMTPTKIEGAATKSRHPLQPVASHPPGPVTRLISPTTR